MTETMPPIPKITLITGAAKRLGRAIALDMARAGWDVAVHFGTSHADAVQTVSGLIDRCTRELGIPDCLINSASLFQYDTASSFQYANLDIHMRINVAAPITLARDLQRVRQASPERSATPGVVINLLDQKLANPNPDFLSYTLSKAALQQATTLLAQALAPHLRVVGVAPGITLVSGDQTPEGFANAHTMTPLGKSSTPQDISAAVVYLATAHAVTGTTLYVDGGQHLQPSERDVMFLSCRPT